VVSYVHENGHKGDSKRRRVRPGNASRLSRNNTGRRERKGLKGLGDKGAAPKRKVCLRPPHSKPKY